MRSHNKSCGQRSLFLRVAAPSNKWFNNVELVTSEKIGLEPTTYVRNIYKYYVSYKLTEDAREQAERLKQDVAPANK